ncbi:DUF4007 family protein [Lewinella sp. LCG006]|uniref:DUF4007 family protein n=1 Tax=Lewinella sp. LCG006 TaxID=3231911 RepID=UPI00345F67CE
MGRISFSGHESFTCKQFWLKKGADFVNDKENSFSQDQAIVTLGVGKNMVRAIRFWLKAFDVTDENDELTSLGQYLFIDGKDPYLESLGSIWLLHYHLVARGRATIYDLVFNDFRRIKPEFRFEHLQKYIERYCDAEDSNAYNRNTVKRDIRVLLNNYLPPSFSKRSEIEDSFSGLLYELNLLQEVSKQDLLREEVHTYYSIEAEFRENLPWQIVLYAILDNDDFGTTITFQDLYSSRNSPGSVFALSQEGLYQKIEEICSHFPECSYSETAGNRVLQISKPLEKSRILDEYYN